MRGTQAEPARCRRGGSACVRDRLKSIFFPTKLVRPLALVWVSEGIPVAETDKACRGHDRDAQISIERART